MPSSEKCEEYIKERFGVKVKGEFHHRGDYWYCREPEDKYETNGIRAVRDMDIGLKPTTYFLQLIENSITKNQVKVDKKELEILLDGKMIQRDMSQKGYIAIFYESHCIGCGFYKDGLVSSRIPKGRGKELIEFMR